MDQSVPIKNGGGGGVKYVFAKRKQFLFLSRHPQCYSYNENIQYIFNEMQFVNKTIFNENNDTHTYYMLFSYQTGYIM